MVGFFRLLFFLAIVAVVAGIAFYFAPDNVKEKGLSYISGSTILPNEVKKVVESVYATPAYRRKQLIAELESNLSKIQSVVQKTSDAPDPTLQLINRTKEIAKEILEQNSDPNIIKQITDSVTNKLIGQNKKPEGCSGSK